MTLLEGRDASQRGPWRSCWRWTAGTAVPTILIAAGTAVPTILIATGSAYAQPATPADPLACRIVRLSDVGWTDVTATTAVLAHVLGSLGYEPRVTVLSVPVTFASLRNGDIDAFLGNWMPSQQEMIAPYLADRSIEVVATNLRGARYTLAVPTYLHDAGLRDFRDIARFRVALGGVIHGIEAGNEANETLLSMIRNDAAGLRGFRLVESSEQGMLAEVERAVRAQRPIVFLGWSPHPMNSRFGLRYLSGGDVWFGPDFGGATVRTLTRPRYADACPNVARLLRNVTFTVDDENALMDAMLTQRMPAADAANAWSAAHGDRVRAWLSGVTLRDGRPASTIGNTVGDAGLAASAKASAPKGQPGATYDTDVGRRSRFETVMTRHKLPVGEAATRLVDFAKQHARGVFDGASRGIGLVVRLTQSALAMIPAPLLMVILTGAAWLRRRSIALAVFVPAALLLIMNLGYWAATIETLGLVVVAAGTSTVIGVPVGVLAARRPAVDALLRPVLDLMQTLPTFVYLTPTLVLFGLGVVPGLVSTIIFALPAPIRLTQLGIASVPRPLIEAGQAFGATPSQLLMKIELPSAASAILTGVSQCIMLSLSMVVIAALVGAGGLGVPVVRALNTVQVGMGIEAGLAIVLVAIILDRLARPSERTGTRR
ncbi:Glycine betaine transport system permease protein OpuAB [Luteitalea pratensis]|uniref:Glycine betaine transport system permease protein OpuAB n=1 Tax=Luteitalea pratensis TaxID=1855912 RepID=A0A143PN65_LUTPR|nr:choline ABC transporter substrate-binding protein [Luteitalea pratensis]AMY10045.1 Glycine betaine transport system permease protein OpuAB [Luteitalea pratensis]